MPVKNVVFDIGGVLLDFGLHHLYATEFPNLDELNWFLANVLTRERWIETDAGKPVAEMVTEVSAQYPDYANSLQLIDLEYSRAIKGAISETVDILFTLHQGGCPLYCISNFPAEKFPIARETYPFLGLFRDTVISGQEKIIKPDPGIFEILLHRNDLNAEDCIFIDDVVENVSAAQSVGMAGHHFRSAGLLADDLQNRGIL